MLTLKDLRDLCPASNDASQSGCNLFIFGAAQGLTLADGGASEGGKYVQKKTGMQYCAPYDTANAVLRGKFLAMIAMDLKAWAENAQMPATS